MKLVNDYSRFWKPRGLRQEPVHPPLADRLEALSVLEQGAHADEQAAKIARAAALAAEETARKSRFAVSSARQGLVKNATPAELAELRLLFPASERGRCCWAAKTVPCVCAEKTECVLHGTRCEGSHD